MSSLLFLNTKDSINPNTPHESTFILNDYISANFDSYEMAIQSVEVPNLRYPIHSLNDKIYFSENGGGVLTATITQQDYNATQLATEVAAAMTSASGIAEVYSGAYDSQTKKITIPAVGVTSIDFRDGANDSSFVTGLIPSITKIQSYEADNTVRLDGTMYVDVRTSLFSHNYSSNGHSSTLFRVPLLVSFGNVAFHSNNTDDFLRTSTDSMQSFSVSLYDDQSRPFILPSNANVSFVIKFKPVHG